MIHIIKNNRQEGPYPEEEVRQKIFNGELVLTDLGWREGLPNWTSLSELLGMQAPPPLPIGTPSSSPLPVTTTSKSRPASVPIISPSAIVLFVVVGLGLLGAYFDIHVGRAIHEKIQSGYSDF